MLICMQQIKNWKVLSITQTLEEVLVLVGVVVMVVMVRYEVVTN